MKQARETITATLVLTLLTPGLVFALSAADRDFDGDGIIGFGDFLMFAKAYGTQQTEYDLSDNGDVDFSDFLLFVQYYGKRASGEDIPEKVAVTLPSLTTDEVTMEFVYIPPGVFTMGQPFEMDIEFFGSENEAWPKHEVTISKGFYLGKYEVTQRQWEAVMGTTPWHKKSYALGDDLGREYPVKEAPECPASYVSWKDVQGFISTLNRKAGEDRYRLPTEAEWEYVCRAGTTTDFSFGNDQAKLVSYAWCAENARRGHQEYAHKVGTKLANRWKLCDMHGNVSEWCHDWRGSYSEDPQTDPTGPASGGKRINRGGDFLDAGYEQASWRRYFDDPNYRSILIGFRLAMRVE